MIQLARDQRDAELDRLGDEIAELAAHVHAATYQVLVRLREFDRRDGWGRGFRSCAHWLSWRTGIAPGAAREKVRVAHALERLPLLSDAMRCGELSFAKVRALTRVATPLNEVELLEVARHGTAAHLEKIVRAWRRVDRLEEQRADEARHRSRSFTMRVDETGMYEVQGRLEPEVGAVLQQALDAALEAVFGQQPARSESGDFATAEQRRVDAIAWIAERSLENVGSADYGQHRTRRSRQFEVVVHVDAAALQTEAESGQSLLQNGVRVSAETSRRIACDAQRVTLAQDKNSRALNAGRRTRTVSQAMRRALEHRDLGCRFPGCGLRFTDAHHIVHWADGGATRLENLVLLCRRHHRAVHEEGFSVEWTAEGELRFLRPDGRVLPGVPPAPTLPEDPTSHLVRSHLQQALPIEASAAPPNWNGERLDLDWAILTLRRPVERDGS
jgi:hypothetical protein